MNKIRTNIYYRDIKDDIRSLTYGDSSYDIKAVNDQGALVKEIIDMGLTTPRSVILCVIENMDYVPT
jgi:hypothetical protein